MKNVVITKFNFYVHNGFALILDIRFKSDDGESYTVDRIVGGSHDSHREQYNAVAEVIWKLLRAVDARSTDDLVGKRCRVEITEFRTVLKISGDNSDFSVDLDEIFKTMTPTETVVTGVVTNFEFRSGREMDHQQHRVAAGSRLIEGVYRCTLVSAEGFQQGKVSTDGRVLDGMGGTILRLVEWKGDGP